MQRAIIGSISPIPRWYILRSIERIDPVPNGELDGVERGLSNSLIDTCRISPPNDAYANYLLAMSGNRDLTRFLLWEAMGRIVVYLAISNHPYANGLWRIPRGRRTLGDIDSILRGAPCCYRNSPDGKTRSQLGELTHGKREASVHSIRCTSELMSLTYWS